MFFKHQKYQHFEISLNRWISNQPKQQLETYPEIHIDRQTDTHAHKNIIWIGKHIRNRNINEPLSQMKVKEVKVYWALAGFI